MGHTRDVLDPNGSPIKVVDSAVYLGTLLTNDAANDSNLNRRLGEATASFHKLADVWKRSGISTAKKLRIFDSCVVSKLLFSLDTQPLSAGQGRRIDGFQGKCLRKILKILPSFFSRISNQSVREIAGVRTLSDQVRRKQLLLFGSVASSAASDPLRAALFAGTSLTLRMSAQLRRVGRPRLTWASQVLSLALELAGSPEALQELFDRKGAKEHWRALVDRHYL